MSFGKKVEYPRELCIHQCFEAQAELTPDNVAVDFEGREFTYKDLNLWANRLANHLMKLGVSPSKFVGLCLKRSEWVPVSVLGILKAGGACVLLDPASPKDLLKQIMHEVGASVLLTQAGLPNSPSEGSTAVVYLDDVPRLLGREDARNPKSGVSPKDAAFVIHTSGSTGIPKGVVLSHRASHASMHPETSIYRLRADDRVLLPTLGLLSSDIFWPWLAGARAVFPSDEGARDGSYMLDLISERKVTVALLFPSMLELIMHQHGLASYTSLRCVISAGEPLSSELQDRFFANSKAELYNAYGQTEAGSTIWKARRGDKRTPLPVGRPIPNVKLYLLTPLLRPVPQGSPGEIFISSDNMADGYLNRPDMTGERFLPDPFGSEPDSRMYRTGDIGAFLPDGNLVFLGRTDNQVKVRGFRVDLVGIEAQLRRLVDLDDAAVIAKGSGHGRTRLVAFMVPGRAPDLSSAKVRELLKRNLPDYMIPSEFVTLDKLPRLPDGKVDRTALRALSVRPPRNDTLPPRTRTEELVAKAFAEVLDLPRVGASDDFLALGGDSLSAAMVASKLSGIFRIDVPVQHVFESPTPAGLASLIEGTYRSVPGRLPRLRKKSPNRQAPLVPAQRGIWAIDQVLPGNPFFNLPMAIELRGRLNQTALRRALGLLVARHQTLRTTVTVRHGEPFQVPSARRFSLRTQEVHGPSRTKRKIVARDFAEKELLKPFDLGAGPLVRALLLQLEDDEWLLLVTLHHLVADGWSVNILWRELAVAYSALSKGQEPNLPSVDFQFADFACWQRDCLTSGAFGAQRAYWMRELARSRSPIQPEGGLKARLTISTSRLRTEIPRAPYEGLRRLARLQRVTLFDVVLSGLTIALGPVIGQETFFVGTTSANRSMSGSEGIVGLLANTVLVRCDSSGGPTIAALLRRAKESTLRALSNQDLPFEEVAATSESEGGIDPSKLLKVMFVLQNDSKNLVSLPEVSMRLLSEPPGEGSSGIILAHYNLLFEVHETASTLICVLTYKTQVFERAAAERILNGLTEVLLRMAAEPTGNISSMHLGNRTR